MIDIDKLRQIYKFGKDLTLNDAQKLLKSAQSKSVKKRTFLFEPGASDTTIYYLRKGLVRIFYIKENGEEITFGLLPEHRIVANFEFIMDGSPSKFHYETLEESSFYCLDYNTLENIISHNPKLEANRKFLLRRMLKETTDRIESFVLLNSEERYLKFTKDFPDLTNRVPDKYIAQVLGMTPVSLSRVRRRIALRN